MNMNYAKPLRKSDNIGKSPGETTSQNTRSIKKDVWISGLQAQCTVRQSGSIKCSFFAKTVQIFEFATMPGPENEPVLVRESLIGLN